ncbi:MAG: WD40/YVTN/BNR-like repeat-containing protein [Ktedonobacterales bacterium]
MMPNDATMTVPGADCARYAPLLPLTTIGQLDAARVAAVRAHVLHCAYCQDEVAHHERLDGALRRVVDGKAEGAVLFSREEILRMRERVEGVAAAGDASLAREHVARRTWSGLFIGIPAIAAVLLLTLFAGFVFHLGSGRGIGVGPVKRTPLPSNIDLYSISMVSTAEGWAVGGTRPDPNYSPVQDGTPRPNYRDPVLAHYHDGIWDIAALPAAVQTLSRHGLSLVLYGVSMVSEDEGWAVGGSVLPQSGGWVVDGSVNGVLLHYTRGMWVLAAGGSDMPVFSQVRMRSATDGWAVAGSTIYRYDGNAWRQVKDAALKNVAVSTLALVPEVGIWAVGVDYGGSGGEGFDGDAPSVFLHFDGSRWARVVLPLPDARISSIAMTSAGEGWAVGMLAPPTTGSGSSNATTPHNALILHYYNGTWVEQARYPGPVGASGNTLYSFNRVFVNGDGQGWAVGSAGLMAHYTRGGWKLLPSVGNAELHDVVFVSPSDGWAVGERGAVLHYAAGTWSVFGA